MVVQSVIFNKKKNSIDECIKWLYKHDFKVLKMHETEKYYRFRQKEPVYLYDTLYTDYVHYRVKTVDKKKDIKFIVEIDTSPSALQDYR